MKRFNGIQTNAAPVNERPPVGNRPHEVVNVFALAAAVRLLSRFSYGRDHHALLAESADQLIADAVMKAGGEGGQGEALHERATGAPLGNHGEIIR